MIKTTIHLTYTYLGTYDNKNKNKQKTHSYNKKENAKQMNAGSKGTGRQAVSIYTMEDNNTGIFMHL